MNRNSALGSAWVAVFFFITGVATAQITATDDLRQGNQFYAQKDYANAARSYQAAIDLDPRSSSAYQGLGNSDYYLGKKTEALEAYQKAVDLNPQNAALAAFVQRLKLAAIPITQPTATPGTSQTTATDDLRQGNQFFAQKDYSDAAKSYQTAITLDPTSAAAYQGLGNSDYYLGKKAEALEAYQKALALNPQNSQLAAFVERLKPEAAAMAATEKTLSPSKSVPVSGTKTIEFSAMGGVPFTNLVQAGGVITGAGGGLDGYYLVQPWLGLGASAGYHSFNYEYNYLTILTGTGSVVFRDQVSLGYWDLLATAKFSAATQGFNPYLFGGAGVCVNLVSTSTDQVTTVNGSVTTTKLGTSGNSFVYPEVAGGLGLSISFDPGLGAFIQGKYCLVFNGVGNASFVPVECGFNLLF